MHANGTILAESEWQRAKVVIDTLAGTRQRSGTIGEVVHDARNMVTALALYCDLLSEPGVLSTEYLHYASELRLVTAASRRLVEKLALIDYGLSQGDYPAALALAGIEGLCAVPARAPRTLAGPEALPTSSIGNLQNELLANRNLLEAISRLGIAVTIRTEGGARPVRLSGEDLTRVLVNLVKNAAEAMRGTGTIEITLREIPGSGGGVSEVVVSVEDNGPGIPAEALDRIFEPGFTTHTASADGGEDGPWQATHRGLGLSITRSIIEAAGGSLKASNRPAGGARFEMELPVR